MTEIYRWTIQRLSSSSQSSEPSTGSWVYVFTFLAVVAATAVRYLVDPLLGESSQFATYLCATVICAWYGGLWPGLTSLVLGFLAAAYFFVYPRGSVAIYGAHVQVGAALYITVGLLITFFSEKMHAANRRANANAKELAKKQLDLEGEIRKRIAAQETKGSLLRRFVTVQEEERRRISRELHDQCGQQITALQLGLRFLTDRTQPHKSGGTTDQVKDLHAILDALSRDIHDLALELRPPALDELGLRMAIEGYLVAWSKRTRIHVDFEHHNLIAQTISSEVSTALYRVLQESLTNVLKHSQATRASVILECQAGWLVLIVEDQGVGFDVEATTTTTTPHGTPHLGLMGMQERLESVGGVLTVEAEPGVGTTIFAKVPLSYVAGQWHGPN